MLHRILIDKLLKVYEWSIIEHVLQDKHKVILIPIQTLHAYLLKYTCNLWKSQKRLNSQNRDERSEKRLLLCKPNFFEFYWPKT